MSNKNEVEINGGPGCLFFFAAIIIGVAVGHLYEAAYGWLFVGIIFLLWATLGMVTMGRR
jgi:hypothetical protein